MIYIVQTLIIDHNKSYENKKEFKDYYVNNYVPQESDPLRVFNFKMMDKYGHENFFLTFIKPNKGILTHKYFSKNEYKESMIYRQEQQKMFENLNIDYLISEVLCQE